MFILLSADFSIQLAGFTKKRTFMTIATQGVFQRDSKTDPLDTPMNSTKPASPPIYIVDDDHDVLKMMHLVLSRAGYAATCFSHPVSFLNSLPESRAGIVITDQNMPVIDGLELQRELFQYDKTFQLIVISGYPNTSVAVEAMRTGAVTVLDKPCPRETLLKAVEDAQDEFHKKQLSNVGLPNPLPRGQSYLDRLTPRESEVVELVYQGCTNKAIGIQLEIAMKTVEKHRKSVMEKLEVSSLASLIRLIERENR